jgi:hypothetical protein
MDLPLHMLPLCCHNRYDRSAALFLALYTPSHQSAPVRRACVLLSGSWGYYRIREENNGQNGTPDFKCATGACTHTSPRLAVWEDALVIVSEEVASRPANAAQRVLYGSNVYAVDKAALLDGSQEASTALVRTYVGGERSFDFLAPATQAEPCRERNSYLVATPVARLSGAAQDTLQLLSLIGTHTLGSYNPEVKLLWVEKEVQLDIQYTQPPKATQKAGPNPVGQFLALPQVLNNTAFAQPTTIEPGTGFMASVVFADDKLYCTWSTGMQIDGRAVVGVAWAVIDPRDPLRAERAGRLGLAGGNSLIYPSLAVRGDCKGVLAVTVTGPDYFPSAAYGLLKGGNFGHLSLVAQGKGVIDG